MKTMKRTYGNKRRTPETSCLKPSTNQKDDNNQETANSMDQYNAVMGSNYEGKALGVDDVQKSRMIPAVIFEQPPMMLPMESVEQSDSYIGSKDVPTSDTIHRVTTINYYMGVKAQESMFNGLSKVYRSTQMVMGDHFFNAVCSTFSSRIDFASNTLRMATIQEARNWLYSNNYDEEIDSFHHDMSYLAFTAEQSEYNPLTKSRFSLSASVIHSYYSDICDILSEKELSPEKRNDKLLQYMLAAEAYMMDRVVAGTINSIFDDVSKYASTVIFSLPGEDTEKALNAFERFLSHMTKFLNSYIPSLVVSYSRAMDIVREMMKVRINTELDVNAYGPY